METTEREPPYSRDNDWLTKLCINMMIAMNIIWQWKVDWQSTEMHKKACLGFWIVSLLAEGQCMGWLPSLADIATYLVLSSDPGQTFLCIPVYGEGGRKEGRQKVEQTWPLAWMTNYMIRYIKLMNSLRLIGLSSMASAKRFNHVVYPSFLGANQ